jgi:hypothetical protein
VLESFGSRLTYANVMSTVAVFVALGGGAYAALSVPRNSVGTQQLKNGAVSSAKLKSGAVTNNKLASGAVTALKVARNSLTGAQINAATLGVVPSASHASTADSAANATAATNATNAVHANTAGDASTLGGISSSAFIHGSGQVIVGRRELNNGTPATTLVDVAGVGSVTTDCNAGAGSLQFTNHSGNTEDVTTSFDYGAPLGFTPADGGTGGAILGISSAHVVIWQVATRGATPTITTIVASYSGLGPATCTSFAQATSGT